MKKLYACGIDWQHEIGEASDLDGKVPLFYSIAELKRKHPAWKECGIVEVELSITRWVNKQHLFEKRKRKLKAIKKATKSLR